MKFSEFNQLMKYYSYKFVEMLNDKIGQRLIASLIAFSLAFVTIIDFPKSNDLLTMFQIVIIVMSSAALLFSSRFQLLMKIKKEDRIRVFNFIGFSNVVVLLSSSFRLFEIQSSIACIILRIVLAILILSSSMIKTDSMYIVEKE